MTELWVSERRKYQSHSKKGSVPGNLVFSKWSASAGDMPRQLLLTAGQSCVQLLRRTEYC